MDNGGFLIAVIVLIGIVLFSLSGSSPLSGSGSAPLASGPGSGTEIRNPQPVSGGSSFLKAIKSITTPSASKSTPSKVQSPSVAEQLHSQKPGYSRYEGAVRITHVARSGEDPKEEYMTLRNGGFLGFGATSDPIAVTGWTIENSKKERFPIPKAFNIPFIDADPRDIVLPSGGQIHIVTGRGDLGVGFRENGCAGYLNQYYSFVPSVSNSCIDRIGSFG